MGTIIKPCFSHPLTLLSWNIAMAQSSASAPDPAQRLRRINRLISDECALTTPHVLALQECPYPSWGGDQFDSLGYVSVGTQQSHCGYVDLLLQKELATNYQSIDLDELPSVACSVLLPDKSRVAISSSHLAPFKDGFSIRLQQCNSLMNSLTRECDNCILLGDFNMRAAEDETVENLCGGWTDAWKGCGSDFASKFTWNSFANQFHEGGFRFKARFDRCYIKGNALNIQQFSLIGNKPIRKQDGGGSRKDYLSDHFGLLIKLQVDGPVADETLV